MKLLTTPENTFNLSHLKQCPVWSMYAGGNSDSVRVALNHSSVVEQSAGPFFIAADFRFVGGFECDGYVVFSEWDYQVYCVSIWTGNDFCGFNNNMKSSYIDDIRRFNHATGNGFILDDVFPISYKMKIPEDFFSEMLVDTDIDTDVDNSDDSDGGINFARTGPFE